MSTKVRATVESVSIQDLPGDKLTIVLESSYFTTLAPGDHVFVELQTAQGTRVEFHKELIAKIPSVVIEPVQDDAPIEAPIDEVNSTDSEQLEPAKQVKASKKK